MAAGSSLHEQLNLQNDITSKKIRNILIPIMMKLIVFLLLLSSGYLLSATFTGTAKSDRTIVTVHQGDTLWLLAHRYGNSDRYILKRVEDIARMNNLNSNEALQEGQTLIIPFTNRGEDPKVGNRYASREIAD